MLREELLASFRQLEGQFASSLGEAKTLDNHFQRSYQRFQSQMKLHLQLAKDKLPPDNPLSEQIKHFIDSLSKQDQSWNTQLAQRDKGLQFRQGFEDSLLVFVFGKVKSGKSSLGNYIAWGHTDPTVEIKRCQSADRQPVYFSHENTHVASGDASQEAETRREFRVGATEATSSIQGFRLPGLTWVDSPGLHSVTEDNGKLAEEYVQHADLILYTMSSASPGRASDLEEIRKLFSQEKQTLLLLTGSDIALPDWDDEKDEKIFRLQMKPAQTRQAQREYVAKALDDEAISRRNLDIISLSARIAQLHPDDPQLMVDSGMTSLFTTLHHISQTEGVRIKRGVPLNNFMNFLAACRADLMPYSRQIEDFNSTFEKLKCTLSQSIREETRQAQSEIRDAINSSFTEFVTLRNDEPAMNDAMRKARRLWDQAHQQVVAEAIATVFQKITSEFKGAVSHTWQSSTLTLPDFSVEKVTEQIPNGVIKGNRKRNSLLGTLAGGTIGFFVGGPAGAAAGATIGGGLAGAASDGARTRMDTIELVVGDNLNAIQANVVKAYGESVEMAIKDCSSQLTEQLLEDVQLLTRALRTEIVAMTGTIERLQHDTTVSLHKANCATQITASATMAKC
ncbi:dynamin family protein [Aeromonas veronii]